MSRCFKWKRIASGGPLSDEAIWMRRLLFVFLFLLLASVADFVIAQAPNESAAPLTTPPIPAGPQPTATVTPLQASPSPTVTVTPLPSASPAGTQPVTTNTVAPSPKPSR